MTPPSDRPIAFDELLTRAAWVRALAARLVDGRADEDADDLAQDVYVAALAAGGEARSPGAWLAGAARNLARRGRRSAGRRNAREVAAARDEAVEGAHELVEKAELQARLIRTVTALDEPMRTTVLLRFFEGLSPAEIGARMGVPASTVRTRLARALERLRDDLDRAHGSRAAWSAALGDLAGPLLTAGPMALTGPGSSATPGAGGSSAGTSSTGFLAGAIAMKLWMQVVAAIGLLSLVAVSVRTLTEEERAVDRADVRAPVDLAVTESPEEPAELADVGASEEPARTALAAEPASTSAATDATPAEEEAPLAVAYARLVDEYGAPLAGGTLTVRDPGAPLIGGVPSERDRGGFLAKYSVRALTRTARSGEDGRVELRFDRENERAFVFVAQHEGRATRYVQAKLTTNDETFLGDLELVPGGVLRGAVVDARGRGVSGARVFVDSVENTRTDPGTLRRLGPELTRPVHGIEADADGRFVLQGVTPGPARVWASAEGYGFVSEGPLEVSSGENPRLELVLTPLANEDTITGIVLSPDGEPVETWISYDYQHGDSHTYTGLSSDADGRFELTVVSRSPHNFVVRDGERRWPAVPALGVEPGGPELVVRFQETGQVRVVVTDDRGAPVTDYQVSFDDVRGDTPSGGGFLATGNAQDAEDGAIDVLAPTLPFEARVVATGYEHAVAGPFQPDAAPEVLPITLVRLPGVRGRVVADGDPVRGARVFLGRVMSEDTLYLRNGYRCRYGVGELAGETDDDGRFHIFAERTDDYVLRVEARGYAPKERELFIDTQVAVDGLVIEPDQGGAIAGRVLLPDGADPEGVIVGFNHGDGQPFTTRIGPEGTFEFANLAEGGWQVSVVETELLPNQSTTSFSSGADLEPLEFDCFVQTAETTVHDLDLRARAGGRLLGRLGLVDGATGWSAALLRIDVETGIEAEVGTDALDAGGGFEVAFPEPGAYRLILGAPAGPARLLMETTIELAAGDATWEMDLALGSIAGTARSTTVAGESLLYQHTGAWPASVGENVEAKVSFAPDANGVFRLPHVPVGAAELARYEETERGFTERKVLERVTVIEGREETVRLD